MVNSITYSRLSKAEENQLFENWQQQKFQKARNLMPSDDSNYIYNLYTLFNVLAEAEEKCVKLNPHLIKETIHSGPQALSDTLKSLQKVEHGFSAKQKKMLEKATVARVDSPDVIELFNGVNRIYLRPEGEITSETQNEIEAFLANDGYIITDYKKGYATDQKDKQSFKIGKLLKKNQRLFDAFSADSTRTIGNMLIVISKDPMDIARMSTNRAWPSCMAADREKFPYVSRDIERGTLIAYMVSENDPYINYPFARILIKPYTTFSKDEKRIDNWSYNAHWSEYSPAKDFGHLLVRTGFHLKKALTAPFNKMARTTIFEPENKIYGLESEAFAKIVAEFIEENLNAGIAGNFMLDQKLYKDNADTESRFIQRVLAP